MGRKIRNDTESWNSSVLESCEHGVHVILILILIEAVRGLLFNLTG